MINYADIAYCTILYYTSPAWNCVASTSSICASHAMQRLRLFVSCLSDALETWHPVVSSASLCRRSGSRRSPVCMKMYAFNMYIVAVIPFATVLICGAALILAARVRYKCCSSKLPSKHVTRMYIVLYQRFSCWAKQRVCLFRVWSVLPTSVHAFSVCSHLTVLPNDERRCCPLHIRSQPSLHVRPRSGICGFVIVIVIQSVDLWIHNML